MSVGPGSSRRWEYRSYWAARSTSAMHRLGKVVGDQRGVRQEIFQREDPWGSRSESERSSDEIVGVAKTARYNSLKREIPPVIYMPYTQRRRPLGQVVFELRTAGNPLSLANTVRRIVAEGAPRVPVFHVTTRSDQIDETISQELTFADLCTALRRSR